MLGVTQAQGVAEEFNLRFNKAEPNAYKHVTSGVQAHKIMSYPWDMWWGAVNVVTD